MGEFGIKEFFVGGVAGATGIVVGHPIDTIRIRFQTEQNTFFHILKDTIKNESAYGLYKGMLSPLSSCFAFNATLFYSYSKTRHFLEMCIAGGVGGFACALLTCPTEFIKIKVQVSKNMKNVPYSGSISCGLYLIKERGIFGLFRGMNATILRDVPGYIAYFYSYNICKQYFIGDCSNRIWEQNSSQLLGQLVSGGIAGIVGWLPGYPFEVIKTRIQAEIYPDIRTCIKESYKKEGLKVFSRGLSITMLRAIPVNATTFLMYEILMDLLGQKK